MSKKSKHIWLVILGEGDDYNRKQTVYLTRKSAEEYVERTEASWKKLGVQIRVVQYLEIKDEKKSKSNKKDLSQMSGWVGD